MSDHIAARLRESLGAVALTQSPGGRPRIAPDTIENAAGVLALASAERWSVQLEGQGSWGLPSPTADLVVTTTGLDTIPRIAAADLVATVQAGVSLAALNRKLHEAGIWLPWDPPGGPDRTIGGIIAAGTAGPLRLGFGPIRDSLVGCTIVTGDGRILRPGGTVVKNVAGYDLTRFQAGGFGAFGLIAELHLRLRANPGADRTHLAHGDRDILTRAGRGLIDGGLEPASLELLSPALGAHADWTLAVRLIGPDAAIGAQAAALHGLTTLSWMELTREQASAFWHQAARGALGGPVTLRLGTLLDGIDATIDLLEERLDSGLISAGAGTGSLRWTGSASAETLIQLRRITAEREVQLTVERAPGDLLAAVGHFGAYREGVGRLVAGLRGAFDPQGILQVPTDAEPHDA